MSKYHTFIDCSKKRVVFQSPGSIEFIFIDSQEKIIISFILVIKVRRLLNTGCIRYLINMIGTRVELKVKLEDVSIVSELL